MARADDQRVAASKTRRAARGQGAEGMIPGTGLTRPAAGIGRVHLTGALIGRTSVWTD